MNEILFRALLRYFSQNQGELIELQASSILSLIQNQQGTVIEASHGGKTTRFILPDVLKGQSITVAEMIELLERVKWAFESYSAPQIKVFLATAITNKSTARWA